MADEAQPDHLADLRAQNQAIVDELGRHDTGVDPSVYLQVWLQTLVDLLLPPGGPFRHLYDLQVEIGVNRQLTDARDGINRRKLLEGVPTSGQ